MKFVYYSFLITFSLLLASCKNSSSLSDPAVKTAEDAFAGNATPETYNALITSYLDFLKNHKEDKKNQELVLERALSASEKMGNKGQQVVFLNNLMKEYPNRADHNTNVLKMVQLLDSLNRLAPAHVMSLCYIKANPQDPKSAELKKTLPSIATPEEYILEIGKAIFSDTIKGFSEENARVYVDACEAYALTIPNDSETPEFIFKAAETSNTLRTYDKSFALYDWIIDNYPTHKRAPMALFMKAFLFDGTFADSTNSRKYYTEFLEKYPNHEFAKDAKLLLQNVGKSDEEVLKELMDKNKK